MRFVFSLMFLGLIAAAAVGVVGLRQYAAPGPLVDDVTVVIARGQGGSAIADALHRGGVLTPEGAFVFKVAARLDARTLKAGEYQFPARVSIAAALDMLAEGRVVQRRFTIPEGKTSWQAVQILNATDGMAGVVTVIPAEGSLLPDTYSFEKDDARADKIVQMQAAMKKTIDELWPLRDDNLPIATPEEAVILASIVEKETGVAAERAHIASVFINRLRRGMPLQSDPTVIYALTHGRLQDSGMGPLGRRLLKKDLEVDSPYNTYKNPGLPPGPIANPGRDALQAVLHPEVSADLYFVADGTGGHVFSKTLAEHNDNVAKWREIRRQRRE